MRKIQTKSEKYQLIVGIILLIFIVIASFSAGFLTYRYLPMLKAMDFSLIFQAYSVLESNFIDPLPTTKQLEYGMIRGMLNVVNDPYTIFVEPAQHELQTNQLQGKFGGIGARLERDIEGHLLLYPFPDSPAQKAGIGEGDRLVAVENLQITPDVTMDEIQAAIRGPVGKKLELTIAKPPGYSEEPITIEREEVMLPSVTWNLAPDAEQVGVIQINIIAATTPDEVKTAVLDLGSRGAEYYILDLRDNSGGLLQAGVQTAELFLDESVILQQQYRNKEVEEIANETPGIFLDIPLVVLINHGSASAAEIIAGALQAQGRGLLIGSNSYGKDTIQLVFDLNDGSSLHVTAARWWIPGLSYSIGEQGIVPDIVLSNDETFQPIILETAIESLIQDTQN